MSWLVIAGSLIGAAGAYRYFIVPPALRFASTEALWIAASYVGDALLAVALLILVTPEKPK